MRALGPAAALKASFDLLRARPVPTLVLGAALLTSLLSVVCGVGAFAAAWFLCELFALQIGIGTGTPPVRTRAWLWAGLVQVLAVLVMSSTAGLALLAVGADVLLGGARSQASALDQVGLSAAVVIIAGGLSLALTVHFEHTPAILIDRGGSLSWALVESARLVSQSGSLRTWLTSGVAHGLQVAPAVLGVSLASVVGSMASIPQWALVLVPLCTVGLTLGQGMVVSSYLVLREHVAMPPDADGPNHPSGRFAILWTSLLTVALAGPMCVSAALLRPSRPAEGSLEKTAAIVLELAPTSKAQQVYIPDTALSIRVNQKAARVVASDGGGAGKIPLVSGKIAHVRVARVLVLPAWTELLPASTSAYAVEVTLASGRSFTTFVDEAGVRLDDSATRRLSVLLPTWSVLLLGLCLVWTAIWIARALPKQKKRSVLWLVPASATSLWIGLWAAFA